MVEVQSQPEARCYMELVPEQPFGPPEICYSMDIAEIPAVIAYEYGKGLGVYVPFNIGTFYYQYGHENSYRFLKDVITQIAGLESIAPNVTPMCEIAITGKKNGDEDMRLIQLINLTGASGNNQFFEPIPLENLEIRINVPENGRITTLNGGVVTREGNTIILDRLNNYEAILIH
jgi:hypothetical protein